MVLTEEIKREVGQHFVFGFHGFEASTNIKTLIQEYHVGNIILMKRNIQNAAQTRKLVNELQKLARDAGQPTPLLIGIDQENGLVSAFSSPTAGTVFPGALAIAATGSAELIERVSEASAKELKMVGINWVYSPVADVNTDSRNPVIGVRSFGDDPNKVATYAAAVTRGHRAGGVASTAKHFPGHGDTHVDSHLALPVIQKSKEQLEKEELIPFKSLIDAGIPSVMTGHMALPLITGSNTPCSLSREITTGLLKEELGFSGLVVTDCLEMDAIAEPEQGGCGVTEGAIRAVEAGADVVMICHTFEKQRDAVEGVYKALEEGRISIEEVRASGRRVVEMKEHFASEGPKLAEKDDMEWQRKFSELQAANKELSRQAYLKSTTIVWNGGNILPLKAENIKQSGGLMLFTPAMETVNRAVDSGDGKLIGPGGVIRNTAGASYLALAKELEEKVTVEYVVYGVGEALPEDLKQPGAVVFVMRNADLRKWQLEYLEKLQKAISGSVPLVLVSSCGPYDLGHGEGKKYNEWTGYLATYEFTAEAFSAAVSVIFGEEVGGGKLAVAVDLI
ncbi:hypothetical protein GALMADRAFT_141839 [Galerina marginata CBS 339.88]|uniref:Glycoside hydrolase family 3 N-terminal domain-containing protein n=1 Tax=Galerina marginata (strain CBS 339.88) TaxID=685588 RepID=A0A067T2E2_GALM3|nr:hypothetical protein GALMADRAFT_141839 [Galerina marginata CBS 339.88]